MLVRILFPQGDVVEQNPGCVVLHVSDADDELSVATFEGDDLMAYGAMRKLHSANIPLMGGLIGLEPRS